MNDTRTAQIGSDQPKRQVEAKRESGRVANRTTIVAAAIRQGDMVCFVPRPGRHHNVMRAMAAAGIPIPITGDQGFVTSAGAFVGRFEARDIAREAGQIIAGRRDKDGVPYTANHPQLFSEDVW